MRKAARSKTAISAFVRWAVNLHTVSKRHADGWALTEDDVHLVHDVLEAIERGRRVEDQPCLAAARSDEREGAIDLRRSGWATLFSEWRWGYARGCICAAIANDAHASVSQAWRGSLRACSCTSTGRGLTWPVASGWKVMKSAPASAKSLIIWSTGETIRCTSIGALMP